MDKLIIGYCRVSTQRQQTDGHALERYIDALLQYGIPEKLVFFDVESGVSTTREGLNAVLNLVKAGQVSQVVIPNFDRLTRDPKQWEEARELFNKHDVKLRFLEDGELDLNSPDGLFTGRIKAALAAQVRDRLRSHSKAGHARHRELKQPYKPVFGYIKIDGLIRPNSDLYPESNKTYFEVARHLVDLFLMYKSIDRACVEFKKLYYCEPPSYYGKNHLKAPVTHSLKRWLENAMLRGKIQYLSFGRSAPLIIVEGQHQPLITDAEWLIISSILEANKKKKQGISTDKLLNVLSGVARCKNCGGVMTLKTGYKRKDGTYKLGLCCRRARERDQRCKPEYTKYANNSLDVLEEKVKNALLEHAHKIIDSVITLTPEPIETSPEMESLIKSIKILEAINDPDLGEVIEKKRTQLFLLQESQKMKTAESTERIERYRQLTTFTAEIWGLMSVFERNLLYRDLIEVVLCDRGSIEVIFKP
ncbi:hypothetical protein NIES2101_00340 [Calothrix sp. HK-06]|nr:hypothetical protein NIES2101_00340 [Calothrix sp. HK-06]